ncbi:uncharacterized protein LOC133202923 [Saccostrea echinata]|uniref:uncharacterized protein LOC133202923 n=1 Tax=Saccostrea echinata TaxID=191078 RepID=UPI002A81FC06|nr:uncharacterized protein LOC133202923 [Saccostrea echinata]
MTSEIIYLIFIFITLSEGGEILTTCDLVGLNLCAWKLGQNISREYNGELSAMPSPEQVALLCRFRPEYKLCYQGKLAACSLNLVYLATLGTTQTTADFLCGEGYRDLMRHNACWEKPLVLNTTNQCNKDYATSAQSLLNKNKNPEMSSAETETWCSIINTSNTCMYDTVLENCDVDAATFVLKMMQKAMTKLVSFLKCQGVESFHNISDLSSVDGQSPSSPETMTNISNLNVPGEIQLGYDNNGARISSLTLTGKIITIMLIINFSENDHGDM